MASPWYFEDIEVGEVHTFGHHQVASAEISDFHHRFAPHLPLRAIQPAEGRKGAPAAQAHVYAIWSRLLYEECQDWPILARLGQDALRWYKTVHAGDALSVRLTFMAKEPTHADRGILVTQHDVLNPTGELVMALLTRTVIARRPQA
jgi:hypothetical protein